MSVAVKIQTGTWSKLFPNKIDTATISAVFVKKLFAVAVSNILYFRGLFPDAAFADKQLEGIGLKILREDSCCPGASKVVYWLRGCFDAVDRKYLKKAIITLYVDKENPQNVSESYSFKFSYSDGLTNMNLSTDSNDKSFEDTSISSVSVDGIKDETLHLLRTILLAGNTLGKLPQQLYLSMRLIYYEDETPEDYVPVGFKSDESIELCYDGDPVNVRVGCVKTKFHNLRFFIQTTDKLISSKKNATDNAITNSSCHVESKEDLAEYVVRCPCGMNKDSNVMILCDGCQVWQHAVCFRIIEDCDVPRSHICELCAENKPELLKGGVTDHSLQGLDVTARRSLCLFRRAIHLCIELKTISSTILAKDLEIDMSIARGLLNRLTKENVLRDSGGKRGEKTVNTTILLSQTIPKFFKPNSDEVLPTIEPSNSPLEQTLVNKEIANAMAGLNVKKTPKRKQESCSTLKDVKELCILSQDSTMDDSTKKRKTTVVNTPIPITLL